MEDQKKTKEQLIGQLAELRQRIAELEASGAARKQMQEDLIRLSGAIEAARDAISMIDLDGKIVSVNNAAVRMHGGEDKSDLIGKSAFDSLPPEDRERALAAIQQILAKGYVAETEYHTVTKDGRRIPIGASGALIRDADGKSIGIVAVVRDIANRKRAEEALQESEQKFRGLTEQSPNMIFINSMGRVVYANKKCEEVMGYTTEEFCSPDFDFLTLIAPESQELVKENLSGHMRGEEVPPYEYTLLTKDGERIEALLATNLIQYGGETAILGTVTDITERKQADEELHKSEYKYRTLVEHLPQRIFLKDRNSVYVSCNANFARDLKIHPDEIAGKTDYDLFPKQVAERYTAEDRNIIESGRAEEAEETYAVNGQKLSVHVLKTPVKDESDNTVGVLGIFWDVTERNKMEEALRESEATHRDIVSSIPGTVYQFVLKKDGSISVPFASISSSKLSGITPKEIKADPSLVLGAVVPEDLDIINRDLAESARTMKPWENEFRVRAKSGEIKWVRNICRPHLLPDDSIIWNGVVIDVTEHKQMEQQIRAYSENLEQVVEERTRELRDAEERYRLTFEYAGDAILVHDRDYVIRGFNRRAEEMFGYKAEEVVGRQTFDIVCPTTPAEKHESDQATAHLAAQAAKQGFYRDQEITSYLRKDRKPFPAEASGAMIRDSKGGAIGFVSIYRDISDRKRLEKEREQYARDLEARIREVERTKRQLEEAQEKLVRSEKLAAIGELAGGVGHELRNPLGAIKNTAYLLNMILTVPELQVKEALEILDKEVARSEHIISGLLDFGRPRLPTQQMVSINHLTQKALFGVRVPEEVEVVSQLDESLPAIVADEDQLGIVFGNIITNAIQAMPEGGKLLVKSDALNPALLAVSFADTGRGIPKENLEKLFEPLFTTRGNGVGLGLAISKALAEMHGGAIEVESQIGKGSTFTVKLPTTNAKVRKPSGKRASRAGTAKLT
jgi:PAS domain S-box-containing protein